MRSIGALVDEVLAANPELAVYEAAIAAARGERTQARTWTNPEFSLEAGHKQIRGGAGGEEGLVWAASLAQPIEFSGRRALRTAIADRNLELAELGLAHFRRQLAHKVESLAHKLYATRSYAEAVDAAAARAMELTESVLQRDTGGVSPLLESRILESSALVLQKRRVEARHRYQSALIELNQLRDVPAETSLRIEEPATNFPELPPVRDLVYNAWTHAFDARVRRVELEQQGYQVDLAREKSTPVVTVAPFISQENEGERETVVGVGVSFPLPIWDRNRGNIAAAEARRTQAEAGMRVVRRELEKTVVEHALAYRASTGMLTPLRSGALDDFANAADLAERHYRLGAIPIATYLETQTAYLDALEVLFDTRQEALESRLEIELLAGEWTGKEPQT